MRVIELDSPRIECRCTLLTAALLDDNETGRLLNAIWRKLSESFPSLTRPLSCRHSTCTNSDRHKSTPDQIQIMNS